MVVCTRFESADGIIIWNNAATGVCLFSKENLVLLTLRWLDVSDACLPGYGERWRPKPTTVRTATPLELLGIQGAGRTDVGSSAIRRRRVGSGEEKKEENSSGILSSQLLARVESRMESEKLKCLVRKPSRMC